MFSPIVFLHPWISQSINQFIDKWQLEGWITPKAELRSVQVHLKTTWSNLCYSAISCRGAVIHISRYVSYEFIIIEHRFMSLPHSISIHFDSPADCRISKFLSFLYCFDWACKVLIYDINSIVVFIKTSSGQWHNWRGAEGVVALGRSRREGHKTASPNTKKPAWCSFLNEPKAAHRNKLVLFYWPTCLDVSYSIA